MGLIWGIESPRSASAYIYLCNKDEVKRCLPPYCPFVSGSGCHLGKHASRCYSFFLSFLLPTFIVVVIIIIIIIITLLSPSPLSSFLISPQSSFFLSFFFSIRLHPCASDGERFYSSEVVKAERKCRRCFQPYWCTSSSLFFFFFPFLSGKRRSEEERKKKKTNWFIFVIVGTMGLQIPWLLVCVSSVPIFMIYTKAKRMDAREMHEIQMRIKYHSEYWKRGNVFVKEFQRKVAAELAQTADPLTGRDIASLTPKELAIAEGTAKPRRWWIF